MSARAWATGFVCAAVLGVAGLLLLAPRASAPEVLPACRAANPQASAALPCLDGQAPSILTAELAGTRERWACQLYRGASSPAQGRDPLEALRCAEGRSRALRAEVRGFDSGFFIPLYSALSLLLVAGLVAQAHGPQVAGHDRRLLGAAVLALATAGLAALDGRENRAVLQVLDALDAWGVAAWMGQAGRDAPLEATVDALAHAARLASLQKWAATAPWVALVGWAASSGSGGLGRSAQPRWMAWLRWAPAGLGATGAVLFAAGTAWGWADDALALPVRLLRSGMGLAMATLIVAAVARAVELWIQRHHTPDAAAVGAG